MILFSSEASDALIPSMKASMENKIRKDASIDGKPENRWVRRHVAYSPFPLILTPRIHLESILP